MDPLEPRTRTRAWAWVVTGPVGHLWGGVADWTALFARLAWRRVVARRGRGRRSGQGPPGAPRKTERRGGPATSR